MISSIRGFFATRPFAAGVVSTLSIVVLGVSLVAAKPLVQPFINGTIAYVANTSGPVVYGDNLGSGIGVEGVTDTGAASGAIALEGFGTSTTHASVGVDGSVDGPGSTALIGNANAASGAASVGLEGFAANGEGVFAESLSSNFPSLRSVDAHAFYDVRLSDVPNQNAETATLSTPTAFGAAIVGQDTATASTDNSGVVGTTNNGLYGVEGTATGAAVYGVYGVGKTAGQIGIYGTAAGNTGVQGNSDTATGVFGSSDTGIGMQGTSQSDDGAFFNSTSGDGVLGTSVSANGVVGETEGNSSVGVFGDSGGFPNTYGVAGEGSTAGVFTGCATDGHGGTGTDMIIGVNSSAIEHYTVDCSGVVSTFLKTRHGMASQAYAPSNTLPTLEDEGEAQLVNGSAVVRLDSTFADSISDRSTYLVFITPQGDSRGLYVSHKTLAGFEVHESMGGRSTIAFDYRIVAKPNGIDLAHMPLYASPQSVGRGHPLTPARVRAPRVPRMSAKALAAQRLERTIHVTNIYEPRMGADGKIHSVPIKYTNVVNPH
jgi:hypothetical protein